MSFWDLSLLVDVERMKGGIRATPQIRFLCEAGDANLKSGTPEQVDPDAVKAKMILRHGPLPHNGSNQRIGTNDEQVVFPASAEGVGRPVYARTNQAETDGKGDEISIFV